MKILSKDFIYYSAFLLISSIFILILFYQIFFADNIIFPYSINPFNLCEKVPNVWLNLKILFFILHLLTSFILARNFKPFFEKYIFKIFNNIDNSQNNIDNEKFNCLSLFVGQNIKNEKKFIFNKGLYQNILITRHNRKWKNDLCNVSFY